MALAIRELEQRPDLWSELHGFFDVWIKDKRCPLPLAAQLMDNGYDGFSEIVKWAATKRDRIAGMDYIYHRYSDRIGVFPRASKNSVWWYCFPASATRFLSSEYCANFVPDFSNTGEGVKCNSSVNEAFIWLLDESVKYGYKHKSDS